MKLMERKPHGPSLEQTQFHSKHFMTILPGPRHHQHSQFAGFPYSSLSFGVTGRPNYFLFCKHCTEGVDVNYSFSEISDLQNTLLGKLEVSESYTGTVRVKR